MNRSTISVVLPNYNHAKYLPIALQAILDQTCPPTEVLVVDDCSTDESWDILNDFAGRYSSIRLFRNPQNMGVIYNLNLMLARVSCEYVYTAASDDKVAPELFQKSIEMLVKYPQAAFCSSECMEIDKDGEERGILETPLAPDRPSYVSPKEVRALLRRMLEESSSMHWFHGPTVLQRSSVRLPLGPFDLRLHHFCDGFLYHLMALMTGCCYLPEVLACWRHCAANYSVAGQLDINRRMEVVREAKKLMFQYCSVFPRNYVHDWEKRHICETRTFLGHRFQDTSTMVIRDLANPVMRPGILGKAGLWVWSVFVVCQTAALMFAAFLTFRNGRYWQKRVTPRALSRARIQMRRLSRRACIAIQVNAKILKRFFSGLRGRGGQANLRSIVSRAFAGGTALGTLLLVRLANPVFSIRFGVIDASDCARSTEDLEAYLCARELNLEGSRKIDLFWVSGRAPFKILETMWNRKLHVHRMVEYLVSLNFLTPKWHLNTVRKVRITAPHLLLENTRPHLSFTKEEEQRGRTELSDLGVPDGCSQFVCFVAKPMGTRENEDAGDGLRRCLHSMESLARRGHYVIWMNESECDSRLAENRRIVSYTLGSGSGVLDAYLPARCRFLVGWDSVPTSVATVFRRPVVRLEWDTEDRGRLHNAMDLLVPARFQDGNGKVRRPRYTTGVEPDTSLDMDYWVRPAEESRQDLREFLSLRGIRSENGYFDLIEGDRVPNSGELKQKSQPGTAQGSEPNCAGKIAVSSEEINAAVLEMDQRLRGEWKTTELDELLQSRAKICFSMLFNGTAHLGLRIGAEFLRRNPDFFEPDDQECLTLHPVSPKPPESSQEISS